MTESILQPSGEIHEAAAVFPMLPDDELQELAEDIKANGLIYPIVLDSTGALVDGRNRLAACQMAGVAPTYISLNGTDPVAYVLSANVARRNLTKGQRAMAIAMLEGGDLIPSIRKASEEHDVDKRYITAARAVMAYTPDLREEVMAGTLSLNDAYERAKDAKRSLEGEEKRREQDRKDRAVLDAQAPDLAELVDTGKLSFYEAWKLWKEREKEELEKRKRSTNGLANALTKLDAVLSDNPAGMLGWWTPGEMNSFTMGMKELRTPDGLDDLASRLSIFAQATRDEGVEELT